MKGRVAAGLGQTYDPRMERAIGPYRVADLERMPEEDWVEVLSLHDGAYPVDGRYTPPDVLRSRAFPTVELSLTSLFAPV